MGLNGGAAFETNQNLNISAFPNLRNHFPEVQRKRTEKTFPRLAAATNYFDMMRFISAALFFGCAAAVQISVLRKFKIHSKRKFGIEQRV